MALQINTLIPGWVDEDGVVPDLRTQPGSPLNDDYMDFSNTEMKGKSEDLMGPVSVAPFDVMQQRTAMLADTGIAMIPPQTRMMDIPALSEMAQTKAHMDNMTIPGGMSFPSDATVFRPLSSATMMANESTVDVDPINAESIADTMLMMRQSMPSTSTAPTSRGQQSEQRQDKANAKRTRRHKPSARARMAAESSGVDFDESARRTSGRTRVTTSARTSKSAAAKSKKRGSRPITDPEGILPPGHMPARGRGRQMQLKRMSHEQIEAEAAARLERNRQAARECRQRRKEHVEELEEKCAGLEKMNRDALRLVAELRQRIAILEHRAGASSGAEPMRGQFS